MRTGNWRIIYLIDDTNRVTTIVEVRRRGKDTYR